MPQPFHAPVSPDRRAGEAPRSPSLPKRFLGDTQASDDGRIVHVKAGQCVRTYVKLHRFGTYWGGDLTPRPPSPAGKGAGGLGHLHRRTFAGLDRAVHVADPVLGRL